MELYRVYSSEDMRMWLPYLSVRISPVEDTETGHHESKFMLTTGRRLKTDLMPEDINRVISAINEVKKILAIQVERNKRIIEMFEFFKLPPNSEGYNRSLNVLFGVSLGAGVVGKQNYLNPEDIIRDVKKVVERGVKQGYRKI